MASTMRMWRAPNCANAPCDHYTTLKREINHFFSAAAYFEPKTDPASFHRRRPMEQITEYLKPELLSVAVILFFIGNGWPGCRQSENRTSRLSNAASGSPCAPSGSWPPAPSPPGRRSPWLSLPPWCRESLPPACPLSLAGSPDSGGATTSPVRRPSPARMHTPRTRRPPGTGSGISAGPCKGGIPSWAL